jgi:hypothetical protein
MKTFAQNIVPFVLRGLTPLNKLDQNMMKKLRKLADRTGWTVEDLIHDGILNSWPNAKPREGSKQRLSASRRAKTRESLLPVPKTQSEFLQRAQRNAFRRPASHQQSRLFAHLRFRAETQPKLQTHF